MRTSTPGSTCVKPGRLACQVPSKRSQIIRTAWLPSSATTRSAPFRTSSRSGSFKRAAVAAPWLPLLPGLPSPMTTLSTFVEHVAGRVAEVEAKADRALNAGDKNAQAIGCLEKEIQ